MTPLEFIKKISAKAGAAERTLEELAVAVVEGEDVAESKIDKACLESGHSLPDFAKLVETLHTRKESWDSYHSEHWETEIDELKAKRKGEQTSLDSVRAEIRSLQIEEGRLDTVVRGLNGKINGLANDRTEAKNAMRRTLLESGREGDWRDLGTVDVDDDDTVFGSPQLVSKPGTPSRNTRTAPIEVGAGAKRQKINIGL